MVDSYESNIMSVKFKPTTEPYGLRLSVQMSLKVATWNKSQCLYSDYCTRCQEQYSLVWSVCHSFGSLSQHIMLILFILATADSLWTVSPAARSRRLASHDWTFTAHAYVPLTLSLMHSLFTILSNLAIFLFLSLFSFVTFKPRLLN
jgi:hypothetical protein